MCPKPRRRRLTPDLINVMVGHQHPLTVSAEDKTRGGDMGQPVFPGQDGVGILVYII